MATTMERLSTGKRINSAKDDAAGLAISDRMTSQVSGLNMAVRNANDAISLLQTVDGAAQEISNMLNRMYELAVQANTGTYTATDRTALDLEFGALIAQIQDVAEQTEWNGNSIMDASFSTTGTSNGDTDQLSVQLGAEATQVMYVRIKDWRPTVAEDGNMTSATDTSRNGIDSSDSAYGAAGADAMLYFDDGAIAEDTDRIVITSQAAAAIAITLVGNAIEGAAAERAQYGAYMSRLQHAADNLQNVSTNTSASLSRIADADYATETTELARTQIISQASTAMLAQANQVKQTVLSLLQ
jgi:flagellin